MAAAKGYSRNIGLDSVQMPFRPDFMKRVSMSRAALDADVIISLPKFKTHGLTVMTGAIKNSYGLHYLFLPPENLPGKGHSPQVRGPYRKRLCCHGLPDDAAEN